MTGRGDGEQFSAIELERWTRDVLLDKDEPLVEEMLLAEDWLVVESVGGEVWGEVIITKKMAAPRIAIVPTATNWNAKEIP